MHRKGRFPKSPLALFKLADKISMSQRALPFGWAPVISSTIIQCCDVQKTNGENLSSPSLEIFDLALNLFVQCSMFNASSFKIAVIKNYDSAFDAVTLIFTLIKRTVSLAYFLPQSIALKTSFFHRRLKNNCVKVNARATYC